MARPALRLFLAAVVLGCALGDSLAQSSTRSRGKDAPASGPSGLANQRNEPIPIPRPKPDTLRASGTRAPAKDDRGAPAQRGTVEPSKASETESPAAEQAAETPAAWSAEEVLSARARCVELLAPIVAQVSVGPPLRAGACGTPAPAVVESVGSVVRVSLRPAVTINCPVVVALHRWLEEAVQPAAREVLGEEIVAITGASGYQCRNRADIGRTSEHGFANAVDVLGFQTRSGRRISVLDDWGAAVTARVREEPIAAANSEKTKSPEPGDARAATSAQRRSTRGTAAASEAQSKASGAKAAGNTYSARPDQPQPDKVTEASPERRFLERIHKSACGPFATVLGPDANEDHRDHLHLDLAQRRNDSTYCR